MQQCIGQHGDDAGDVGEEEQIDDENRQEGQYLPDDLMGTQLYRTSGNGYEVRISEHMERIKREEAERTC